MICNNKYVCLRIETTTWWLIPVSKWIITPVTSELTLLSPVITRGITYLLSGLKPLYPLFASLECYACYTLDVSPGHCNEDVVAGMRQVHRLTHLKTMAFKLHDLTIVYIYTYICICNTRIVYTHILIYIYIHCTYTHHLYVYKRM